MLTFASTLNGALATLVQGLTESDVPGTSTSCNDYVDEGSDADAEESEFEEDEETDTEAEPVGKKNEEPSRPTGIDVDINAIQATVDSQSRPLPCSNNEVPTSSNFPIHPSSNAAATPSRDPLDAQIVVGQSTRSNDSGSTSTASPPAMHSQIIVPSDTEMYGSDGSGQIGGYLPDSPSYGSQQVDEQIRGSAAHLAANLSSLRVKPRSPAETKNLEIKLIVARELRIPLPGFNISVDGAEQDDNQDYRNERSSRY